MAVNKNFTVRHGLEVNTNLILADANTNKVGIGSTAPRFELDVAGGIGATDFYLSGVGTFAKELNVGTDGSVLTALGIGGSVGIGTALPGYLLDIRSPVSTGQTALYIQGDVKITGDLSVDDIRFDEATIGSLYVTGVSTFIGPLSSIDVNGHIETDTLRVSGLSTFSSLIDVNAGADITGHTEVDDINVSGVATISQLDVQNDFDVYATTSTFYNDVVVNGDLTVNGTQTVINTQSLFVNDKDIVLGIGTTPGNETDASANHGGVAVASTEGSPLVSFTSPGINTFPNTYKQIMWVAGETFGVGTTDAWLFNYAVGVGSTQVPNGVRFAASAIQFTDDTINTPNINVSSGGVTISSGIVTSTTGIVTYYGDGQYLQNVISYTGIGINSEGVSVGTGVTVIDFRGAGISTITVDSGIGTIFVQGGGSGTVSISSIAPSSPENGDLWYSIDYGRTFVYYDEVTLGIGSTAVWVDAAPFNLGILNIDDLTVGNLTVTNSTNVTNINATGIVTAVDFNSTSDQSLKTNINTIDNALDIVNDLRGVSFDWKETGKSSYGVIAQELEKVLPSLVSDTEIKTVNYNGIIGVLIEAVKELSEEVERLKNDK
jgi:hypothetical protein